MKHTKGPAEYNKRRFSNALRAIEREIEYFKERVRSEEFGVAEGCLTGIQTKLTLLYGLMLNVQDDKIRGKK